MSLSTTTAQNNLFVQSLAKGLRLLEAFSGKPSPLSLNELATYTGLDRSTTQRMAHTLVSIGYLERGHNGRGYVLGKKCLDVTFDFLRAHPLIERATPILIGLQKEVSERIDLSLFDDLSIIYASRHQSERQSFFATLVGRRIPTVFSSGGRAIMSRLSCTQVDDIIARSSLSPLTPKSITSPTLLRQKVAEAKQVGYALAVEEALLGEIAMASPIVDHAGMPVAAIHIVGSRSEWTPEEFVQRFSPLVISAARSLNG